MIAEIIGAKAASKAIEVALSVIKYGILVGLPILVIVILCFGVAENRRKTTFTVSHMSIDLKAIKEINELAITRFLVPERRKINFDKKGTPVDDGSYFLDYIVLVQVDAVIPMEAVSLDVSPDNRTINVSVGRLVIGRANSIDNQSFMWNERSPTPNNAVQIAVAQAKREAVKTAIRRGIQDESNKNAKLFFECFFKALGFEDVQVSMPAGYEVDDSSKSMSPFINEVLKLEAQYADKFDAGRWHVDPEVPEGKLNTARGYDEFKKVAQYVMLFFDTHGGGKTGLILTEDGVYWRNGYWRSSKDTKNSYLPWEQFALCELRKGEDKLAERVYIKRHPEDSSFFDCNDVNTADNILGFLKDLQAISAKQLPQQAPITDGP